MAESPTAFNAANAAPVLPSIADAVSKVTGGAAPSTTDNTLANLASGAVADVIADLKAGLAVFTALNDTVGANAYQAILTQIEAIQAATAASAPPKVHVGYDLAVLRTLVLAVQPNSPVANAVAPLAAQVGQQILTIVNGIVTGAAVKIGTAGIL